MNLSRKTSSQQEKAVSRIELACLQDASVDLLLNVDQAPENVAPSCPMKLHSFMVMASYITRWHKVMVTPEKFIPNKDYN